MDILSENMPNIKNLDFEQYIDFLIKKNSKLSKKDIFTNTRYILTGNNNGPSVKDLFVFFGYEELKNSQ